jgi:hypothetical protein
MGRAGLWIRDPKLFACLDRDPDPDTELNFGSESISSFIVFN